MYMKPSLGIAFVVAAKAGVIASSKGRASVAPRPRKNERRGSEVLGRNMV
jgi:hypothetical protein